MNDLPNRTFSSKLACDCVKHLRQPFYDLSILDCMPTTNIYFTKNICNNASLINSSVDDLSSGIRSCSYCVVLRRTLGLTEEAYLPWSFRAVKVHFIWLRMSTIGDITVSPASDTKCSDRYKLLFDCMSALEVQFVESHSKFSCHFRALPCIYRSGNFLIIFNAKSAQLEKQHCHLSATSALRIGAENRLRYFAWCGQ